MHEATRRLLGVLLRQLDGYGPQSRSIVIGATNRRQDLDPALLSRFDAAISFGYPDENCRRVCSPPSPKLSSMQSAFPAVRGLQPGGLLCPSLALQQVPL